MYFSKHTCDLQIMQNKGAPLSLDLRNDKNMLSKNFMTWEIGSLVPEIPV